MCQGHMVCRMSADGDDGSDEMTASCHVRIITPPAATRASIRYRTRPAPPSMEDPVAELLRLSQPSLVFSSSDVGKAHRLAVVAECFLRSRMEQFLRDNSDGPILVSYQSDSTPEITFERCDTVFFGHLVRRGGHRTGDFLVDRLFARTSVGMNVFFRAPRRLENKTGWTHFAAASEMLMFPWNFGCRSVTVFHVVCDGAVFSSLRDTLHRAHQQDLDKHCADMPQGDQRLCRLSSWFVATQCANHSSHNSFKNALKESLTDDALLKDMWGTIEGLRTCYVTLMEFVKSWVASRLVFRDWEFAHGFLLWTMLGLEAELAERLSELQLRCFGGVVFVAEKFRNEESIVGDVAQAFAVCFRWRKWTDSRWCSMGDSSRSLVLSLLLGIEDLVAFAVCQGHSTYYLAKAKQIGLVVKRLAVQASVVSFVADAALGLLLSDDRLPLMYEALLAEIDSEVKYVLKLPKEMWDFIAGILGLQAVELRSACVQGALTTAASLMSHFQVAAELPWSLVGSGNIERALDELAVGPQPTEAVSWAAWQLCALGYPRAELVAALELLRSLSWSQVSTEQGHSAGSVVMKRHRLLGQAMLQSRSMLRQVACMFGESPEQVKLARLRTALAKLHRCQPQKLGARQAYISEVLLLSKELHGHADRDGALSRRLVARCGQRWCQLSHEHQHRYEVKSKALQAERTEELERKKQEAMNAIRKQRSVVEESACVKGPLRVGSCRFSPVEVGNFAAACSSRSFFGKSLARYRSDMESPVCPPSLLEQDDLLRFAPPQEYEHRLVPDWINFVGQHRAFFHKCVLRVGFPGGETSYFAFLCAVLAPRVCVGFLRLEPLEEVDPFTLAREHHAGQHLGDWHHCFRFVVGDFVWSHMTDELAEDVDVAVLQDVCFDERLQVGSDSRWWSWDDIVSMLGSAAPKARRQAGERPPRPGGALLTEHPWLQDVFAAGSAGRRPRHGGAASHDRRAIVPNNDDSGFKDDPEPASADAEDIFEELQKRRALWAAQHEEDMAVHFATQLRGGRWTAAHVGEVVDSLRCYAATQAARDFCASHQMAKSCTLSLRLYGDEVCQQLGTVWMARMTFLMGAAAGVGDPKGKLTAADLAGFQPPEVAGDLRALGVRNIQSRLDGILAMQPGYL